MAWNDYRRRNPEFAEFGAFDISGFGFIFPNRRNAARMLTACTNCNQPDARSPVTVASIQKHIYTNRLLVNITARLYLLAFDSTHRQVVVSRTETQSKV